MPSLQDQLIEIESQEKKHKEEFPRFYKLDFALRNVNVFLCCIGYVLACWCFYLLFPEKDKPLQFWDIMKMLFLALYPGFWGIAIFQLIFEDITKEAIHALSTIGKKKFKEIETVNKGIIDKKKRVLSEIRKEKEQDFLLRLNTLLYNLQAKNILLKEAIELNKILEKEDTLIRKDGYQIQTKSYYITQFVKIEKAIKEFNNPVLKKEEVKKEDAPIPVTIEKKPIQEVKSSEEINNEIRRKKSIVERERFYKILFEGYFIQRLTDFIFLLSAKKCPAKQAQLTNRLLKEENTSIKVSGYEIHESNYYESKFQEIQALIYNKPSPLPPIENFPPPHFPKTNLPIPDHKEIKESKPSTTYILKSQDHKKDFTDYTPDSPGLIRPKPSPVKTPPKEEENTVSELFGQPKKENVEQEKPVKTSQPKVPVKIDFQKLNEHRLNIGELGELYIFEKEQNYLISKGKVKHSKEIIHVSLKSDSEGYDIISFTEGEETKYIEVKTTTGNQFEPFYMSTSEMDAMKRLNNYWIYRVYNFNVDLKKGDMYKIDCSKELDTYYHIKASSFKVSPKLKKED